MSASAPGKVYVCKGYFVCAFIVSFYKLMCRLKTRHMYIHTYIRRQEREGKVASRVKVKNDNGEKRSKDAV